MALYAPIKTYAREVRPGEVDFFFEGSKVSMTDFYNNLMSKYGYSLENIDNMLPSGYIPTSNARTGLLQLEYDPYVAEQMATAQTPTSTAPTRTTTPTTPPQMVYNGQIYGNISDYTAAVNADLAKKYNDATKIVEKNFQNGIISLDERNDQIEQTRKNLAEQYSTNLGNVQGTFSKLSPEALQSAQSDYENRITSKYNEAKGQLGELPQNYRTMSEEQLASYSNPENPQYLTESGGLARDYANLVSTRQSDLAGADDWVNTTKTNIISNLLNASDNYASAGDYTKSKNMSDFANYFAGMQFTPMAGMGGSTPSFAQVTTPKKDNNKTPITSYAGA